MKPDDPTVTRLRGHMQRIASQSGDPKIWATIDGMRARRGRDLDWPPWCYLPLAATSVIAGRGKDFADMTTAERGLGYDLGVLAAWRPTQGIYRYHPDVLEALWNTPVTGDIPSEVLFAIPEWCVYIETPHKPLWTAFPEVGDAPILGYFALLNADTRDGANASLRFDLDCGDRFITTFPIVLGGNLIDGIQSAVASVLKTLDERQLKLDPIAQELVASTPAVLAQPYAPLVSTLLYLCAQNAEVRTRKEGLRPTRPKPVKTKDGPRYFPPPEPVSWEVGWRVGAAIAAAKEEERRYKPSSGAHARPRPHIRKAHWHSFWTGPKAKVGVASRGERKLILHWLPPLPVNVSEDSPVIPTVHPVERKL